jgi:hypothetical protein
MLLISMVILAFLLGLLERIQLISIPDPIIQGIFGVAVFCIAALIKRGHSWR